MITREVLYDVVMQDVRLNPDNPRVNDDAVGEVVKSIQAHEYISPIIVDEGNVIIAGNTRYKAMQKLNATQIPMVVRISGLTPDQKRKFIVADNKTHEFAQWDWEKLAGYPEDVLKDVGFSSMELDKIFRASVRPDDDDTPPVSEKVIAVRGDIFKLGPHRIMCGDSTADADIDALMGRTMDAPVQAALGFTSPPYWVGKDYETQKNVEEIEAFITLICGSYNRAVRKDYSRIVINTGTGYTTSLKGKSKRQVMLLMDKWTDAFNRLGWNLRHVRHWIKSGQLMALGAQSDMIDQHCEFLGTFENDAGADMKFDDKLWDGDVTLLETFYNVGGRNRGQFRTGMKQWATKGYWDDIRGTATESGHSAAFPVELVVRNLFLYTLAGEIVLDLFMGSGTTVIAAQKMNRVAYGMELDPKYVDLTIRRFMRYAPEESAACLTRTVDMAQYKIDEVK